MATNLKFSLVLYFFKHFIETCLINKVRHRLANALENDLVEDLSDLLRRVNVLHVSLSFLINRLEQDTGYSFLAKSLIEKMLKKIREMMFEEISLSCKRNTSIDRVNEMERTLLYVEEALVAYTPKVKVQITPFKTAKDAISELESLIGDKKVRHVRFESNS